jgi:hypothetical protein
MSHVRKTIRNGVVTLLNNSTHALWTLAYPTRIPPTRQQAWDFIMVYPSEEPVQAELIHSPNVYTREMTLNVIGMLRMPGNTDTQSIEDKMDAMAVDIETRLTYAALSAVVSGVESFYLVSTAMDVIVTEDDKVDHAELSTVWRVGYSTTEGAPETFI